MNYYFHPLLMLLICCLIGMSPAQAQDTGKKPYQPKVPKGAYYQQQLQQLQQQLEAMQQAVTPPTPATTTTTTTVTTPSEPSMPNYGISDTYSTSNAGSSTHTQPTQHYSAHSQTTSSQQIGISETYRLTDPIIPKNTNLSVANLPQKRTDLATLPSYSGERQTISQSTTEGSGVTYTYASSGGSYTYPSTQNVQAQGYRTGNQIITYPEGSTGATYTPVAPSTNSANATSNAGGYTTYGTGGAATGGTNQQSGTNSSEYYPPATEYYVPPGQGNAANAGSGVSSQTYATGSYQNINTMPAGTNPNYGANSAMAQPKVPKGAAYYQRLQQLRDSIQQLQNNINQLKLEGNKDLNYQPFQIEEQSPHKDFHYDASWQPTELFALQAIEEPLLVGAGIVSTDSIIYDADSGKKKPHIRNLRQL